MQRTPEPELMDDPHQAAAYAEADFAESDAAFVREILVALEGATPSRVIDLGCGPGNIALRLADALPDSEVLGVDGSEAMLQLAWRRAEERGNLSFLKSFIPNKALPEGGFDLVVSNSLLHHLHDPQGLWQTVAHLGGPDTLVIIGDLRRPPSLEAAQALVQRYADGAPEVLRQDFYASLCAAFSPNEVQEQLLAAGLEGWRVEPRDDRHLVVIGRL